MSLNDNFTVALLPINIVQGDIDANLTAVANGIGVLDTAVDLVVLPELFSTGYISDKTMASLLAQPNDGETIKRLKLMAAKYKTAISGSHLATTDDKLYNRAFFIEPNGETTFYDKRHLFCISKEAEVCVAGEHQSPVVRYRGWNLAMAVCYDVRFPVWLRNVSNRYDALIVPANWPDKREYAWRHLLQARAIENVAYVIATNRSGCDNYGCYDDLTFVYDYMGQPIGQHKGSTLIATLNRSALRTFRDHFPVWKDADTFKLT